MPSDPGHGLVANHAGGVAGPMVEVLVCRGTTAIVKTNGRPHLVHVGDRKGRVEVVTAAIDKPSIHARWW